jgi:hypothetical protein
VFVLLHKLFSAQPISELKKAAVGDHAVSTDEFQVSGENYMVLQHLKGIFVICMKLPVRTAAYVTHVPFLALVAVYLSLSCLSSGANSRTLTIRL